MQADRIDSFKAVTLKGDDGIAPHLRDRTRLVGLGGHVDHDGGTGGLYLVCLAVDQMLQQREALVTQAGALGEDFYRFIKQCWCQETAVHIGDDDCGPSPVDVGLHIQSFEVMCFSQIKELEID